MLVFALEPEGEAALCRLDGTTAQLDASRAAAPGSTLVLAWEGRRWRLKVHRCARAPQGERKSAAEGSRFDIGGRFVDLTREDRLRMSAALASGSPGA